MENNYHISTAFPHYHQSVSIVSSQVFSIVILLCTIVYIACKLLWEDC